MPQWLEVNPSVKEVRQLKKLFEEQGGQVNSFVHVAHLTNSLLFETVPRLEQDLVQSLVHASIELPPDGLVGTDWTLQRHNVSVESHTDDAFQSKFFVLWVLDSRQNRGHESRYESGALFRFTSPCGQKQEARLRKGDVIAFNATKPHELLYCGEEVFLAVGTLPAKTRRFSPSVSR